MAFAREYEEFRVHVHRIGPEHYLAIGSGPAGTLATRVTVTDPARFHARLVDLLDLETHPSRPRAGHLSDALQQLGAELFETLFEPDLRACFEHNLKFATQHGRALRVRFALPDELASLPLEALYHDEYGFLSRADDCSIVRSISGVPLRATRKLHPRDGPKRVQLLVVVAQPVGSRPLDGEAELRGLEDALATERSAGVVSQRVLGMPIAGQRQPATQQALMEAVQQLGAEPSAVLIIAHGRMIDDQGAVLLERGDGRPDAVLGRHLAPLLTAPGLRFVALNLCVGGVAERDTFASVSSALIRNGVPAVLAMQADLSDAGAVRLSPRVFGAVLRNQWLDQAVAGGRQTLSVNAYGPSLEWAVPTLAVHDELGLGWLFKSIVEADPAPTWLSAAPVRSGAARRRAVRVDELHRWAWYCRIRGEWEDARTAAQLLARRDEREQANQLLEQQAETELRAPEWRALCRSLAGASHPDELERAFSSLTAVGGNHVGSLPPSLVQVFSAEIARARQLETSDVEAEACAARNEWPRAIVLLEEIVRTWGPDYRSAGERLASVRAARDVWALYDEAQRAELSPRGWPEAARLYLRLELRCAALAQAPSNAGWAGAEWWKKLLVECAAGTFMGNVIVDLATFASARVAELEALDTDTSAAWQATAHLYAMLPDAYAPNGARSGEARQRRFYARARAARCARDWQGVCNLLHNVDGAALDGAVGLLNAYAQAKLDEAAQQWAAASERYTSAGKLFDAPAAARRSRALARYERALAAADSWAVALEALDGIAESELDGRIGRLRLYAQARLYEQAQAWPAAATAFAQCEVPPGSLDVLADAPARAIYAAARAAELDGHWDLAEEQYERIPEFADTESRAAYARARAAERHAEALGGSALADQRWAEAVEAYARCSGFLDSGARQAYARGHVYESSGQWSLARAAYTEAVTSGVAQAAADQARLSTVLAEWPWLERFPFNGTSLVADPLDPEVTTHPARSLPKRLVGDAWLYRVADPERLESLRRAVALTPPHPATEPLREWRTLVAPLDEPLLLLASGDRAGAIKVWQRLLAPAGSRVAHALGIAHAYAVDDLEQRGADQDANQALDATIACWAAAAGDHEYWLEFMEERARTYGVPIARGRVETLRMGLLEALRERLAERGARYSGAGRSERAETYRVLHDVVDVEEAGQRALADAGGLQVTDGSAAISCGPRYVRLFGHAVQLGLLSASLTLSSAGARDSAHEGPAGAIAPVALEEAAFKLRCLFSELGLAVHLLDQHPEQARAALPVADERGVDCSACDPVDEAHVAHCVECQRWAERDPGYLFLPSRAHWKTRDAAEIALRAAQALALRVSQGG